MAEKKFCQFCEKESVGLLVVIPATADEGAHPRCLFSRLLEIGGRPDIGLGPEMLTQGFLAAMERATEDPDSGQVEDVESDIRSMGFT